MEHTIHRQEMDEIEDTLVADSEVIDVTGGQSLELEEQVELVKVVEKKKGMDLLMVEEKPAKLVVTDVEEEKVLASQEYSSVIVEMLLDETLTECLSLTSECPVMIQEAATIIDISEDDSEVEEEKEILEEIIEEAVKKSVEEAILDEIISFVIEQDPEVVCQEIVESVLEEVIKTANKKEVPSKFLFTCSDIRYRNTSTKPQETSLKLGLSLFVFSKESNQKISKFMKEIQTVRKLCCALKNSVPSDLVRVDCLFRSDKDRSKFQDEATRMSENVSGLLVHSLASTEKDLGMMEKPVLTEDEIMWIYSESQSLNLFASKEFKVSLDQDVSGSVKFRFEDKNIQLSTFLCCVLKPEKALHGRVKREANIHLPLRMKCLEKRGRAFYPVEVAGAPAEDIRTQEAKFGFKIFRTNPKTGLTHIDFENPINFYKFWTSSFSHKLNKVKFSQVTAKSD